jgi:predicted SprT family Zn-dependent metalloprotease
MQLDFLARLIGFRARAEAPAPAPAKTPSPAPAPTPVAASAHWLARAQALLRQTDGASFANRLTIRWNPRMRSTAGTAHYAKCLVTLNPALLAFGEAEVDRTLRHELAHLLASFRAGRRRIAPHGPEWRRACADLGLPDETRCHDLPLPRRSQTRRHAYLCPTCGAIVHRVRPLRPRSACSKCCSEYNRGRYDARFQFVKMKADAGKSI